MKENQGKNSEKHQKIKGHGGGKKLWKIKNVLSGSKRNKRK